MNKLWSPPDEYSAGTRRADHERRVAKYKETSSDLRRRTAENRIADRRVENQAEEEEAARAMTFECGYCTALFADPDGLYAHAASASHGLAALELDRLTQQAFNIYSRL